MKYRIFNKKTRTYYKSTPFKNQFHWTVSEWHVFRRQKEAEDKIDEIVSIKKLTNDDLVVEMLK